MTRALAALLVLALLAGCTGDAHEWRVFQGFTERPTTVAATPPGAATLDVNASTAKGSLWAYLEQPVANGSELRFSWALAEGWRAGATVELHFASAKEDAVGSFACDPSQPRNASTTTFDATVEATERGCRADIHLKARLEGFPGNGIALWWREKDAPSAQPPAATPAPPTGGTVPTVTSPAPPVANTTFRFVAEQS